MLPEDAEGLQTVSDLDQPVPSGAVSLIWVFTVCPDLSVLNIKIIMILPIIFADHRHGS